MAKRLKILITTDYYEPWTTGVTRYIQTLTTFFPAADITVLTYNLTESAQTEKHGNVTIKRIPSIHLLGKTFILPQPTAVGLPRHDVVITNTRFFTTTGIGIFYAHKWKAPHIHVEHGNTHVPHANPLVRFIAWVWDQTCGRIVMHAADKVICVSKKGMPFVQKLGAKNAAFIANTIDATQFKPSAQLGAAFRKKHSIPANKRVVTFIGRLVEEKGLGDLILALSGSADTLVVVGGGKMAPELEHLAAEKTVDAVFIGDQPQSEVHAALCATDVFVNPSWAEGLPTSVLEALAAKVRVIATDVGGTSEILPKEYLVPARAPSTLRRKLLQINRMNVPPFPEEYSLTHSRKEWEKLLKQILE
jgi:glycosyltransferase involved in cell wall biosynthesis